MKIVLLLSVLLIGSCVCVDNQPDRLHPDLEFEEYTLTDSKNISIQLRYWDSPYPYLPPYPDYIFSIEEASFFCEIINEIPKKNTNKRMIQQLTEQAHLLGIEPGLSAILPILSNRFSSITITSDKKYRHIEAGELLNNFFLYGGDLILNKGNRYDFFINPRVLHYGMFDMRDVIFPAMFTLIITHPPIIEDTYTFYVEFTEANGNKFRVALPEIRLKAK